MAGRYPITMITENISRLIAEAMKAKDEIRLSTFRLLSSALNYEFIAKQHKLNEEEELVVVKKEAKKRKDAIEALRLAQGKPTSSGSNMDERIKREEQELTILQEFLPPEIPDEELRKLVDEAIKEADLPADATHQALQAGMGKVMGLVMAKTKGQADGGKVAEMVKGYFK
ncbi:MAG: GatB/YqeY [Candidatus Woesebacteria bacterium GW2011_GWB1_40_101]|uniref:GatB/YqeY n=3 Tax=Candidatus Woeseibacteriota TaxID=1752722 RepID=A0A0G0SXX6_9BACT|nr:MAG: GatB/YqeY [Candidatus Woesebacteria bacterium GW2011_GWB1_40_101]